MTNKKPSILLATILLIAISILPVSSSRAQTGLDSLWQIWENASNHDTIRLDAISDYIKKGPMHTSPDSLYHYAGLMYDFAKPKSKVQMGEALVYQGISLSMQGKYVEALGFFESSLEIYEKSGTERHKASSMGNLARAHAMLSNIDLALKYYSQVLEISERAGDDEFVAIALNNIANIHVTREQYDKALVYYKRSLTLAKKAKSAMGMALANSNLAMIYAYKKNVELTYKYVDDAVAGYRKLSDSSGVMLSISRKGILYEELKEYEKAIPYFLQILQISQDLNIQERSMVAIAQLARTYLKIGNYRKAEEYAKKGLELAEEFGSMVSMQSCANVLYQIYAKQNKFSQALDMLELATELSDSILREENQNELIHQEYRYSYLKKSIADSVERMKEKKITNAVIARERAEKNASEFRQNVLYIGLAILILFLGFVYNRFLVVKKQKKVIEKQKKRVEEQKILVEEAAKTKLEYEQLKQERLKADLTNAAQEILRRQEWLEQFKEKLYKVKSLNIEANVLSEVFIDIANQMQLDARNQEFYKNIDLVNQDFFRRLKDKFPRITQKEQELCGLIRLNLSTKEIASVRNVEAHSIRIARSRLRKRLGLERADSLFDFLQEL